MNKISFVLLMFFICCKKKESKDFIKENPFPVNFINPHTEVKIQINQRTDEIIEALTNYNLSNKYNYCYDNKANVCGGKITKSVKMYFEFTNNNKEMLFLTEYSRNCDCKSNYNLYSTLESISLNKISRIDTISAERDAYGKKLTSILIYPKYNNDEINYKNIRSLYDSVSNTYGYAKDFGSTNNPIIIQARKKLAINLKNYFEELVLESKN